MITAVTVPRSSGGGSGSGGISDTSVVNNGLLVTSGPMNGIANPPNWLNRLLGGPLTRSIDRLIGSCLFQSDNVFRTAIKVVSLVSWMMIRPGPGGRTADGDRERAVRVEDKLSAGKNRRRLSPTNRSAR